MSLINEALQRADADKRASVDPARPGPRLIPPPPPAPRRRLPVVKLAAILGVLAGGSLLAWKLLVQPQEGMPKTAKAAPATAPKAPSAAAASKAKPKAAAAAAAEAAAAQAAKAAEAAKAAQAARLDAELADALGKTLETMNYYEPTPAAPAEQPAPPKPAEPARPAARVDSSKWQLSGIINGPEGAAAFINGKMATVGMEVDGARVVQITRYGVVLDVGGQKVTIGM